MNNIKRARTQGMIAAYLNLMAIVVALVIACVFVGVIVGLEGRPYSLQLCIERGKVARDYSLHVHA